MVKAPVHVAAHALSDLPPLDQNSVSFNGRDEAHEKSRKFNFESYFAAGVHPSIRVFYTIPWGSDLCVNYRESLKIYGGKYHAGSSCWHIDLDSKSIFYKSIVDSLTKNNLIHSILPIAPYISLSSVMNDFINNEIWNTKLQESAIALRVPYDNRDMVKDIGATWSASYNVWLLTHAQCAKITDFGFMDHVDANKWFMGFCNTLSSFTCDEDFAGCAPAHYFPWQTFDGHYFSERWNLRYLRAPEDGLPITVGKRFSVDSTTISFEHAKIMDDSPHKDIVPLKEMIVMTITATSGISGRRITRQHQMSLKDGAIAWKVAQDLGWTKIN